MADTLASQGICPQGFQPFHEKRPMASEAFDAYLDHVPDCPACLSQHSQLSLWQACLKGQMPLRKTVPLLLRGRIAASFADERRRDRRRWFLHTMLFLGLLLGAYGLGTLFQQPFPWKRMVQAIQQQPMGTSLHSGYMQQGAGNVPLALIQAWQLPNRIQAIPTFGWQHHQQRLPWGHQHVVRFDTPLGSALLVQQQEPSWLPSACAEQSLALGLSTIDSPVLHCWQEQGWTYGLVATTTTLAQYFLPPTP